MKTNESHRIFVIFTVDENGNTINVKARANDTAIEKEVLKIMKRFPQVTPGKQRGSAVSAEFALAYKY
jgi:protein TonB